MIRKWPRAGKISLFFAVYKTQLWQGEDSPIFRNKSKPATRISLLLVLHNVKPEFLEECSFLGESRVQGLRALRGLCRAHAGVNVTDMRNDSLEDILVLLISIEKPFAYDDPV
jgi:hypothetical protein